MFCDQKSLGNTDLDNLMSLVDFGKASRNNEGIEYHPCKPCKISQCSLWYTDYMENPYSNN